MALAVAFAVGGAWPQTNGPVGCSAPDPLFPEQVENNVVYSQLCVFPPHPPGTVVPCPRPAPPQVLPSSIRPQELTLTAVIPEGFTATEVYWRALRASDLKELWQYRSIEGGALAPGTTVHFGAPGLDADTNHYFQVTFCSPQPTRRCLCWSDFSAAVHTPAFSSQYPAPPAGLSVCIEDNFHRPATLSKVPEDLDHDGTGDENGCQETQ